MRAADELIDGIVNSSRIPLGKRREIQRELRSHIEDFIFTAREAGRSQEEIEKLVLAHFGDPAEIAKSFAWVYRRERRRLRAVVYALSTVVLASCLSAVILAMQTGLAFGFGKPIMKVLASRHTTIEVLDILASVAAYLGVISLENVFERHRFPKAVFLLTMINTILIMGCAVMSLRAAFLFFGLVNGVFFRAVQLFVAPKMARAGIVVVCFPLAGLVFALQRSPISQIAWAATCASWVVMGVGYLFMTQVAARVDTALMNGLQRIQANS